MVAVLIFGNYAVDIFSFFQFEGKVFAGTVDIADILNAASLLKAFYRHVIGLHVKLQQSFCRCKNAYLRQIILSSDPGAAGVCIYHLPACFRCRHRPVTAAKRCGKFVIFDFGVCFELYPKGGNIGSKAERLLTEYCAVRNNFVGIFICPLAFP